MLPDVHGYSSFGGSGDGVFFDANTPPVGFMNARQHIPTQGNFGVHFQNSDGKTPLHRAVIEKNTELVRSHLYAGAAVNTRDHVGNNSLHYAVIAGDIASIELLLRFGVEVDAKDRLGQTALHLAVSSVDMVKMLVIEGANPSSQDDRGNTPLHLALANLARTDHVADALIEAGSDPNRENKAGITPFLQLLNADYQLREYVPRFLEHGASVTKAMPNGKTPLQIFLSRSRDKWASDWRSSYVLKCFLNKGASVETLTASGEPLVTYFFRNHYRGCSSNHSLAEIFCAKSTPGLVSPDGNTLLHELCVYLPTLSSTALLEVILQKGVDPNHRNNAGQTPLMVLHKNSADKVYIIAEATAKLLAHGANVSLCVLLSAVKSCPYASSMLKSLMKTYISHSQGNDSTPEVLEGQTGNSAQRWWVELTQVAEEDDWNKIKLFIAKGLCYKLAGTNRSATLAACAVLVEKHLCVAKDAIPGQPTEKREQVRKHVAEVIRECRVHDIPVDMHCFDFLLELCL